MCVFIINVCENVLYTCAMCLLLECNSYLCLANSSLFLSFSLNLFHFLSLTISLTIITFLCDFVYLFISFLFCLTHSTFSGFWTEEKEKRSKLYFGMLTLIYSTYIFNHPHESFVFGFCFTF